MTSGGATTLSADSTALALVRMAIGGLPSGITANQANQAIRGAAEFPALVALIEGVLSSSLAPLESGPVVQSLATTVRQAMSTITAILVPPVPAASSAVAYASRSVEPSQLPHFNILSNVAGVFSVYVYSAGSDGSVNVVNASPITWSAHTLNETGTLIPAPSTDDGRILLHANTLSSSLLDIIHPWIGPRSVGLPGNEGKGLDIVVEQTQASRRENLVGILEVAFLEALPIAVSNECLRGGAEALLTAESLQSLASGATMDGFRDALVRLGGGSDDDLEGIISTCVPSLMPNSRDIGRFSRLIARTLSGLAAVQAFDDAATAAAKIVMTAMHWNTRHPVAVCMGETGILIRTPSIQNCAAEFTFENQAPILAPNARFTPRITALTAGGVPTGLPVGLTHNSSDAAQAVVTVLTPQNGARQTGELVANGEGSATITVRDPFTDTSDQYTVIVVRPRITPGVVRMGVGQMMTLSLTDAANHLVITDGSGIRWASSDTTRITLGPFSAGATNTATIIARAPGTVTITVTNPVLLEPITAEVDVVDPIQTTVAGTGVPGYSGDGGLAVNAQLGNLLHIALDAAGNLLIADEENHRVRRVDAITKLISTVVGTGESGYSGDGGQAVSAQLSRPSAIAYDTHGNLYIADGYSYDRPHASVRRVDAVSGIVTTIAGDPLRLQDLSVHDPSADDIPATTSYLQAVREIALDRFGNLYLADDLMHLVRRVDAVTGLIRTVAGIRSTSGIGPLAGFSGDGGPATSARINTPRGIALDSDGNIYIGDYGNHRIRRVDASTGIITTIAGGGVIDQDGAPAVSVALGDICGLSMDSAGNLLFCERSNTGRGNRIRMIDRTTGIVTTVAGNAGLYVYGAGGPAITVPLFSPMAMALDASDNLFVAEWFGRIRRVTKWASSELGQLQ